MTTTQTINLIGIGTVSAIPAGQLIVGQTVAFNYGTLYTVQAVRDIAAKTVEVDLIGTAGKTFTVRRRKAALIAAR